MKNNQFEKGLTLFADCINRDPNNLEAQYLLGVCAFHLERHDQVILHFTNLLALDPKYRKNAYLFLAISHKKNQNL
jgi:cytochrome c-type biogenesis protein CcmH/NrfG